MIAIASDHAGFKLKEHIIKFLEKNNLEFIDLGCKSEDPVDYPDYAFKLSEYINSDKVRKGILICGSGIGMSIAANRHNKIRAALCINGNMAKLAREHNDANILVLGEKIIDKEIALECVKIFLKTKFCGGRHQNRIKKLEV